MEKYIHTSQLQKFERLSRKSSIAFLFEKGKSFTVAPLRITWAATTDNDFPLCVMFSVSKKNFALAPHRNRIKRLLRESYRKNKQEILQQFSAKSLHIHAAFLFTGKTMPEYAEVETKMKAALKKLSDEIAAATA